MCSAPSERILLRPTAERALTFLFCGRRKSGPTLASARLGHSLNDQLAPRLATEDATSDSRRARIGPETTTTSTTTTTSNVLFGPIQLTFSKYHIYEKE